ncbi:MAG: T9SS type A sorting domain-containing protein [Bacteroidales bacterium]|nr:T9SS type A sorting domain-containing protein [Bacteroidales bacterium]
MKKVLFVLGLALCSTLAMAQTNKQVGKLCAPAANEKVVFATEAQPVDYKASIFTKDGEDVVLHTFNFSSLTGVTIGTIEATDQIDDTVVGAINCHNRSEVSSRWARIADTTAIDDSAFAEDYAGYGAYVGTANLHYAMGSRNGINDNNGFMFLSLCEIDEDNNALNTYFSLAPVALNNAELVDVTWRQLYRKYYDICYLDYKLNGSWKSMEINVTGVDVSVGAYGPLYYVATLPPAAINQTNLEVRFRLTADGSLPYGYGWAIDDVKIVAPAATTRWTFNSPGIINGFYGTLPQGMTVPMSYTVFARNTGIEDLTGISLGVQHRVGTSGEWTEAFSVPQTGLTIPAGNALTNTVLDINEAGFMYGGHGYGEYIYYHDFPEWYDQYANTDAELAAAGYTRRGVPTTQIGANQFLITASNAQGLNDTLAAYTYTVTEPLDEDPTFGRTVPGYRWGNDNGIVPGGSEFAYGFTGTVDAQGRPTDPGYVTSDCAHQYQPGYTVMTRYNTPSVIPTDENGEPWVIRGIELVTSTKVTEAQAAGARLTVDMYRYEIHEGEDTGWYYWLRNYTGLTGNEVYLVGEGNVAPTEEDLLDFATAENGNYYAVNVFFPEQPAIDPNTSYWMEYSLQGGGDFAVARQATRYKSQTGGFYDNNNYTSYRDNAELAPYYNQAYPSSKTYDAYCYDPIQGARGGNHSHYVSARNIDYYPLMRLIVGPKMELDTHYVSATCTEDENERTNYWVHNFRTSICGVSDTVAEGAAYSYMVLPGDPAEDDFRDEGTDPTTHEDYSYYVADSNNDFLQSKVIDQIFLNGNPIDLTDSNIVTVEDYTVYWAGHTPQAEEEDRWDPALVRKAYMITLRDITEDIVITATVHDEPLSIRDVEDNVNLLLAPNPATSQVRLKVSSFEGKANCSIIDMSGRVVYNADITSGETVINLNGVPAGAYFVRVTNDTFSKVEKLIVR